MPQISFSDCETLLQLLGEQPQQNGRTRLATARLRQHIERNGMNQASADPAPASTPMSHASDGDLGTCALHVCTSCRLPETPREPQENRPGFKLYQALYAMLEKSALGQHVALEPVQCLSLCQRPCGIALSSSGAWNYLFGDQQPDETATEILQCVSTYMGARKGLLLREERPESLRASILGRVRLLCAA